MPVFRVTHWANFLFVRPNVSLHLERCDSQTDFIQTAIALKVDALIKPTTFFVSNKSSPPTFQVYMVLS